MPPSPEALRTVAALTLVLQNITETFNYQLKRVKPKEVLEQVQKMLKAGKQLRPVSVCKDSLLQGKKLNNETIKNWY